MTGALRGRTVVVAGGGRGLGRATAVELAAQGAAVVVNDLGTDLEGHGRSEAPAVETAATIEAAGGEATAHHGDVTDLGYVETLFDDAVGRYGRVDGVVNFAGVLRDGYLARMSAEQWDAVVDVHLGGHFALLRTAAARWRDRDDDDERSFLCVSSPSAFGNPGQANYAAAKAGVLGLMRTAAVELDRFDVRVNALVPVAYTRMVATIPAEKRPFEPEERRPEQVAPVAAFLLGGAAGSLTGRTIRAAGESVELVADPTVKRSLVRDGGWTVEALEERFDDAMGDLLD